MSAPTTPDGLIVWNRLGSTAEVTDSAVGPDLQPSSNATQAYVDGVFGDALSIGPGSYSSTGRYRNAVLNDVGDLLHEDAGTIEIWYRQQTNPQGYSHNPYRIFDGSYGLGSGISLQYITGHPPLETGLVFSVIAEDGTPIQATSQDGSVDDDLSSRYGARVHLAAAWDRAGIAESQDTLRLYVDGEEVADAQRSDWGDHFAGDADIGGGNDQNIAGKFAIDNLKVWDHARTDFSDRFVEGVGPGETVALRLGGTGGPAHRPAFRVWADGVLVGEGVIDAPQTRADWRAGGRDWTDFTFAVDAAPETLEIAFINDGRDPLTGEDVNLFVDRAVFGGKLWEAETDGWYIPDRLVAGRDGPRENLWWNGTLRFGENEPPGHDAELVLWDSFNANQPFLRGNSYTEFSYAPDIGDDAVVRYWEPGQVGNGATVPSRLTFAPGGGYFGGGAAFNYSGSFNGNSTMDEIAYSVGDELDASGGTIEFWYKPLYDNTDGSAIMYIFTSKPRIDSPNNVWSEAGPDGEAGIRLAYAGWSGRKFFNVEISDTGFPPLSIQTPGESSADRLIFRANEWMHVAVSWDGDGMDQYGGKTLALFVDGVEVASSVQKFTAPAGFDEYLILGGSPGSGFVQNSPRKAYSGASGSFDNLKVWDYAKTDFSDRFVEDFGAGDVLFADSFDGAALSSDWTVVHPDAWIEDGWLHLQDKNGGARNALVSTHDSDPAWTDYSVRCTVDFVDVGWLDSFDLALRTKGFDASSDGLFGSAYQFFAYGPTGWEAAKRNTLVLYEFVDPDPADSVQGVRNELLRVRHDFPTDAFEVIASVEGGRVRAWIDGELLIDHADPTPRDHGGIALGTLWELSARFDDVEVVAGSPEDAGWLL